MGLRLPPRQRRARELGMMAISRQPEHRATTNLAEQSR